MLLPPLRCLQEIRAEELLPALVNPTGLPPSREEASCYRCAPLRGKETFCGFVPESDLSRNDCVAFGAAGVHENWLLIFGGKSVLQHAALGPQRWLEDEGNGRDVSLRLSFPSVHEQRLKNQCHEPRLEQSWAESPTRSIVLVSKSSDSVLQNFQGFLGWTRTEMPQAALPTPSIQVP